MPVTDDDSSLEDEKMDATPAVTLTSKFKEGEDTFSIIFLRLDHMTSHDVT